MKYSTNYSPDRSKAAHRRRYWMLFAVLVLSAIGQAYPKEIESRPIYLGFAPAYPAEVMSTERRRPILAIPYDSLGWFTVAIDAGGRVAPVTPDTLSDSIAASHLDQYIAGMRFEPARRDGKKVASRLRMHARFRPNGLSPIIVWPIGEDGAVLDQTLFTATLRLNGVAPPDLVRFPSYHGAVRRKDSVNVYPFVLTRVSLDSAGVPTSVTPVRSTYPGYDALIPVACNWATYAPARIDGRPVAASVYVLVSYFPDMSYPTRPLDLGTTALLPLRETTRVRLLCDTLGPLSAALPRFFADDSLLMDGNPGIANGEGTVLCLIDTLGRPRAARVAASGRMQPRMQRFVSQLRFFPALDHVGHPINSMGPMRLRFLGSEYVRVDVLWLLSQNPDLLP